MSEIIVKYKEMGGWCPFQSEGSFSNKNIDYSFYFRDRWDFHSIVIWKGLDDYLDRDKDNEYIFRSGHDTIPSNLDYHIDDFRNAKSLIMSYINDFILKL